MYVYILKCQGNMLYTGIAADPERRLRQHLGIIKGGAKFTRTHKVRKIMAIWEDKSGEYARKLECQLKKLTHADKQRLIDNPDLSFSDFGIDIPSDEFVYVTPESLNKKYELEN